MTSSNKSSGPLAVTVEAGQKESQVEKVSAVKKWPIGDLGPNTASAGNKTKLARPAGKPNAATVEPSDQYKRFQAKILHVDKYAEIIDAKTVRHVRCGKELAMKAKFNTQNFKTHVLKCKGPPKTAKLPSGGMPSITHWFKPGNTASQSQTKSVITYQKEPCPGLDEQQYSQVAYYLNRTGASGGGALSVNTLAQKLCDRKFMSLSRARKLQVKAAQKHARLWRNEHDTGKVFSMKCKKTVAVQHDASDEAVLPCEECLSLLGEKKFKTACSVKQKPYENLKFLNKEYTGSTRLIALFAKSKQLTEIMDNFEECVNHCFVNHLPIFFLQDPHARPMLKYVNGLISGEFKEQKLFADLLEAMYLKNNKIQRGKGLQNMRYSPDVVEFSHILLTHSPKAYSQLREHLALPAQRTLQYVLPS